MSMHANKSNQAVSQFKPHSIFIFSTTLFAVTPIHSFAAYGHDMFSLSATLTSGISFEQRDVIRASEQRDAFVAIAQPSLKAMANASLTPFPWLGFTAGAGIDANGFGVDAGHLKKYGATIIHEGKMAVAEVGLEQKLDSWRFQETVSFGRSISGHYERTSDGTLALQVVRDHTRGSIHLRAAKTLLNTFALGAEFSQSIGYVNMGIAQSVDYDEYYRSTLGVSVGIIL